MNLSEGVTALVSVLTAIVGLAIIAVIVSKNANTSAVIQSGASGFSSIISAAVAPVSGGGGGNSGLTGLFGG